MKRIFPLIMVFLVWASLALGCASLKNLSPETSSQEPEEAALEQANATEKQPETSSELAKEDEQNKAESLTGSTVAELKEGETHFVELTAEGFVPAELAINVGDTVVWQNVRSGQISKAMVIGVRECGKVRSKVLEAGESFSWTFDWSAKCTIVDGIMTTVESKVIVE